MSGKTETFRFGRSGPATSALLIVLLVSLGLRAWIVCRGGQNFWPDENRYGAARDSVGYLAAGRWSDASQALFDKPEHIFFKVLGLLPATVELVTGKNSVLPALFYSCFSVGAIGMIWGIARRLGADPWAAWWSAVMMSGMNSLFYYSRHLLPYDTALFFGLVAWLNAAGDGQSKAAFWTGFWAALCFLTYNGYWLLGAAAMGARLMFAEPKKGETLRRNLFYLGIGSTLPVGIASAAAAGCGKFFPRELLVFSRTITQGDLGQAWRFVPEFLWQAEKFNALWLGFFIIGAGYYVILRRRPEFRRVLGVSAAVAGGMLVTMILLDAAGKFVVYGRLVRMALPFACMGGGVLIMIAWRAGAAGRGLAVAVVASYCGQAAINFWGPLTQWFPAEYSAHVAPLIAARREQTHGNYRVTHANFFFAPPTDAHAPVREVLWRRRHPQEFLPYLYEGFTAAQRKAFRHSDLALQVVRIGADNNLGWLGDDPRFGLLDGYPGRVKFTATFPMDRQGTTEPLVVTGESGRGDFLYVIYQDTGHVRFGFDHWGVMGLASPSIPFDWRVPHRLVVGLGSMFPPSAAPADRQRLFVSVDDQVIFDNEQEFHPSESGGIIFGINLIGGSTTTARFSGTIHEIAPVGPSATAR